MIKDQTTNQQFGEIREQGLDRGSHRPRALNHLKTKHTQDFLLKQ